MKTLLHLHKEKIITWTLLFTIVFSFVSYIYLVNRTVLNVVAREEVETVLSTLGTKVSELEFKYISLKNVVTMQYAYDRGFTKIDEGRDVYFAVRSGSRDLSVNTTQ